MTQVRSGDLVIYRPADPTKQGRGPFYVDDENYGGDTARITVAVISPHLGWGTDLPKDEVEVIGHHAVSHSQRLGYAFHPRAIEAMQPIMDQGTQRLFALYPDLKAQVEAEEAERAADAAAITDDTAR